MKRTIAFVTLFALLSGIGMYARAHDDAFLWLEDVHGRHGAGANLRERAFTSALAITYLIRNLMY
jgi:hypothetical protein